MPAKLQQAKHNGYYIRALLFEEEISPSEIATSVGVSITEVSSTIHNRRKNLRVRQVIANKLGLPVHALWADATPSETKEAA